MGLFIPMDVEGMPEKPAETGFFGNFGSLAKAP